MYNGSLYQMKDGYMRKVIRTVRDSHEFNLSDVVGINNFQDQLPDVFELIKEGYILSHKPNDFNFNTLKILASKYDELTAKVESEKQRYEEALKEIGNSFKQDLQTLLDEISLPVVDKYRAEVVELDIQGVNPLEGKLVLEASKAENSSDLQNIIGTTRPFDNDEEEKKDPVVYDPEQEVSFSLQGEEE